MMVLIYGLGDLREKILNLSSFKNILIFNSFTVV